MRSSPQIRLRHLLSLVDDVGIVQHAHGTIPNRSSGYCVDDVSRLVITVLNLEHGGSDNPAYQRILSSALAFLFHAWDSETPGMHNLMGYGRNWLDPAHTGDHLGRAVWALGAVIADEPVREEADPCLRLLTDMQPCLEGAGTPRETAYTIIGLTRPVISDLPTPLQRLLGCRTRMLTTIHGFSDRKILPAYQTADSAYVSLFDADRAPELNYCATVYHGIDLSLFTFSADGGEV
jgi:hypothetical protein